MKARIIIADDHKILRDGLKAVIEASPAYEVIAEASNGREAVKLASELEPDIILMDIAMPDLNGIQATRQILSNNSNIRIIALSMHSDRQFINGMFSAGAYAYILKDSDSEELIRAINCVINNQKYISSKISGIIIGEFVSGFEKTSDGLSDREKEILQLISEGKTSREIAEQLFLSSKTVDTHKKNIMDKLKLYSIPELTKYAIRSGLTSL